MSCDLLKLATPGIAGLQPYQPGKPVEELERELGISNIIKLASNENPVGPGKKAIEAIQTATELSRYPDGNAHDLKVALAKFHGVNTEQLTIGNGSNEILELVTRAVTLPEHEVVFSEHAFAVYPLVTQALGAKAVVVKAKNWGNDLEAMRVAINENTRVVFIANPNNPTGTWLDKQAIKEFLTSCPSHVVVVLDEAYFEYVNNDGYESGIACLNEFPNLLVTRTFSKAYGLAGLRIGYGVSNAALADLMNRVRQPFNVNSLALLAAEATLSDEQHLNESVQLNTSGMQQLTEAFDEMGLDYIPSVGNFICVDVKQAGIDVYQKLLHEGVIVRPVANYDMPNHLRITIGLEEENNQFINALKKVMA